MKIGETSWDWATAIGEQLQSKLVIDMTEFSEDYGAFLHYLPRAQELDKILPHEKDPWGIGLKFVRFHGLIRFLRENGYRDKK